MERLTTEKYPFLEESVISALDQHKLFTARDFISCPTQKIAKITNLLFKEILDIKRQIRRNYTAISDNGFDAYQNLLKNAALISSGVESIDKFLEGGLLTGNIYEIYGSAACGKSLLAYIFMKNLVLEMGQNCFLLEAKNDFSAIKFYTLCREYNDVDVMNGLSKIFIKCVQNKYDLLNSLYEISEDLGKTNLNLRFIVIDSLAAIISNEKNHSVNNLCLSHFANIIHYISSKYHVVFLVLNLMTTWLEGDFANQIKATQTVTCGRFWYTIPNTRIKLERQYENVKLSIEKSNTLPFKTVLIPLVDLINYKMNQ